MARLILMYEMQSAAVKSAPRRGYLIGFTLLMQKNIWVEGDGSMLTRGLIAPREAPPHEVRNKGSEQMIIGVHSFVATAHLIITLEDRRIG